jgi:hypothetical protein
VPCADGLCCRIAVVCSRVHAVALAQHHALLQEQQEWQQHSKASAEQSDMSQMSATAHRCDKQRTVSALEAPCCFCCCCCCCCWVCSRTLRLQSLTPDLMRWCFRGRLIPAA